MKNPKKIIALTLVAALTCSILPADTTAAKKKVQLNKKKVTLMVGKKVTAIAPGKATITAKAGSQRKQHQH